MRNLLLVFLVLGFVSIAFYYLGKKAGRQTQTDMVQNVNLIKEIAELGALEVAGTTTIKVSNKMESSGVINRVKNYFSESTLQLTIPFEAKFGVDMSNQSVTIIDKDSLVIIDLPAVKMLSMQLRLDKMNGISKTGVFNAASFDDFLGAQKRLYADAEKSLVANENYTKLAENHLQFILEKYYAPMGYKVKCVFAGKQAKVLN